MRALSLYCVVTLWTAHALHGQDLQASDVRVTLDSALRIADNVAATAFPELSEYVLYSITPRVLKGDPGGLHWQVQWQARAFPHRQWLVIRVYMNDGHTTAERRESAQVPSPDQASPSRESGDLHGAGTQPDPMKGRASEGGAHLAEAPRVFEAFSRFVPKRGRSCLYGPGLLSASHGPKEFASVKACSSPPRCTP